jgi:HK97 family phage portal protein
VIDNPSTEIDPVNWRRIVVVSWLMRGYAAGLATGGGLYPSGIELIHPDRVTAERKRRDSPAEYKVDGKPIDRWPLGQLWIAQGKMLNPGDPFGRSVLEFAAAEIGLGLRSRKFGSDFFDAGGHPTSLVMGDGEVNQDMAKRVKERFKAASESREPVVLGGGWKYEQVQIAPNESQFLETIKANRTMVAGFFKVPPSLIGAPAGDGMTYKNTESDGINLLRFCILPWKVRMETCLNALTVRPEYVKLDPASLLQTDLKTRYGAHDLAIRSGWKSRNEVRALEDMPPIDGGDDFLWPPYRSQLTEAEMASDAPEEGA